MVVDKQARRVVKPFNRPRRCKAMAAIIVIGQVFSLPVRANPEGGMVVGGSASITGEGTANVIVTQSSDRTIINWDTFSIAVGERTQFIQPGSHAIAANRVIGVNPSEILGTLQANGQVVLVNRNGILFGKNAIVDAAGLIATTHDFNNDDFMAGGPLRFNQSGLPDAGVINEGTITIRDAGMAAFVAPHVRNSGVIVADLGRVALGSGAGFTLDLYGDGLISFAAGDEIANSLTDAEGNSLNALVENDGEVHAAGGRVLLTASAAREVVNQSVNIAGVVRANSVSEANGVITLAGSGQVKVETGATVEAGQIAVEAGGFTSDGNINARNTDGSGGTITIEADAAGLGGTISATGTTGGSIGIETAGLLSLAERVEAKGTTGAGGSITYNAGRMMESTTGSTDASGATDGGTISVTADSWIATSGSYSASGGSGAGGRIDMTADDVRLLSADLIARGQTQGGLIRVGGAFQGGKVPDTSQDYYDGFVGRWTGAPFLANAEETFVNDGSFIDVSSDGGVGGTAVIWSDQLTTFLGALDATGGVGGGSVEISSAEDLRRADLANIDVGAGGRLLLDPKNIIVGTTSQIFDWAYAGILGVGYTGGRNLDVTALATDDFFGRGVALNAAGDRLAVGAYHDDGSGDASSRSGAVYLFTFTDNSFSGGALAATLGDGYSGGNNVDVSALAATDQFGTTVSLNAAGDRLAVGAENDDGPSNALMDSGAVYLFTFTDTDFSGGSHVATLGDGYSGGNNVDVSALDSDDRFGTGVSLNAAGDRLAVSAQKDDGSGNGTSEAGAVYLFTFTDTSFSGGSLAATIGDGYSGGNNVNVSALEINDSFGIGVSLDSDGDRLAVGANQDDGPSNGTSNAGAVYLFTFTDTSFSGGSLAATIGDGYSGGNNVDVSNLELDDAFGYGVSLNAAGNQLAVGAIDDDGLGNGVSNAGAVYLFTFTDTSFSGGSLAATIGDGYTGGDNVDVSNLEAGDGLGRSVSLNAAGDRLAASALLDDGSGNGTSGAGAVYLFTGTDLLSTGASYASSSTDSVQIGATDIANLLDDGTAVTLQASNDITVLEAITVTGSPGSIGALTLEAGRSILINADITTTAGGVSGAVSLFANDTLANGVIDGQRDAGDAEITMATGTHINAGTAAVSIELRDGAGKTNTASGDITLDDITGGTISAVNNGSTAGSGIVLNSGAVLTASATIGTSIELAGDGFTNNAGASALVTSGSGRFLVWSADPSADNRGGIVHDFKQYNATQGVTSVAGGAAEDGFLYTIAPTITPSLTGTISRTYDATTTATLASGNYANTGAIDGDTVTLNDPTSGTYDTKNVGTGKTVSVSGIAVDSATNGAVTVFGYQMASTTANAAIGDITPVSLTAGLTGSVTKVFDGNTTATLASGNYTLAGVLSGDTVTLNNPTAGTYDNANVGTGKTVSVTGLAIAGTDAVNYALASNMIAGAVGEITVAGGSIPSNLTSTSIVNDELLRVPSFVACGFGGASAEQCSGGSTEYWMTKSTVEGEENHTIINTNVNLENGTYYVGSEL